MHSPEIPFDVVFLMVQSLVLLSEEIVLGPSLHLCLRYLPKVVVFQQAGLALAFNSNDFLDTNREQMFQELI